MRRPEVTRAPRPLENHSNSESFSDTVKRRPRPVDAITIRRAPSRPIVAGFRLPPNIAFIQARRRL